MKLKNTLMILIEENKKKLTECQKNEKLTKMDNNVYYENSRIFVSCNFVKIREPWKYSVVKPEAWGRIKEKFVILYFRVLFVEKIKLDRMSEFPLVGMNVSFMYSEIFVENIVCLYWNEENERDLHFWVRR